MASIRLDIPLATSAARAWDGFRDFYNVHKRVVPGFVTDCRADEDGVRAVTFANGALAREALVDCDDAAMRICYASVGSERLTHHNASNQIIADGETCRMIWITDLLPDAMAPAIRGMMEQGADVMQKHFANAK